MFIFNASLAGIIFLGSYFLEDGSFPTVLSEGIVRPQLGILIAFSNYSMQILFGLMMFAMMMIFISRASVSAKRIIEIMDEVVELKNSPNPIGIIGSTGSGKTSLINLIPRLYDVNEGGVYLNGHNVIDLDLNVLRSHISVVTQTATVYSGSIGTNIAQGKKGAVMEDFKEASKNASALEFIEDYDDFFNHQIQQKGSNLSGGQKQRLSLARAFIRKPKILILDDSTSAVDAKSEESILNTINKLSSNMTTLVISQKISTIKDMDKIIVLDTLGRLDGFNTHEELLKTSKIYQEIALSQAGNGGGSNE